MHRRVETVRMVRPTSWHSVAASALSRAFKKPQISRAKRSTAMPCWAACRRNELPPSPAQATPRRAGCADTQPSSTPIWPILATISRICTPLGSSIKNEEPCFCTGSGQTWVDRTPIRCEVLLLEYGGHLEKRTPRAASGTQERFSHGGMPLAAGLVFFRK